MQSNYSCIVCKNYIKKKFKTQHNFITSDINFIKNKVEILLCDKCFCLQKEINKKYIKNINKIYKNYLGFSKFNNNDQKKSFIHGKATSRCEIIFNKILKKKIKQNKNLLDFGSSNGAMLEPLIGKNIKFFATDIKNIINERILKSKNFIDFVNLKKIHSFNKKFDFITMIHVLEHLIKPVNTLKLLKNLLTENGEIIIQIPNYQKNFYDLNVYDHVTHWNERSISELAYQSGLKIDQIKKDVIPCEYTIILKKNKKKKIYKKYNFKNIKINISKSYNELGLILKKLNKYKSFSILGSSIAATWVMNMCKKKIRNIYDQDQNKIGLLHCNKIIKKLDDNEGLNLFLPFAKERLPVIKSQLLKYKYKLIY